MNLGYGRSGNPLQDAADMMCAIAEHDPFQKHEHIPLRSVTNELEWRWLMKRVERYKQEFNLHRRHKAA